MKKPEPETEKFRFLADKARKAGAADARIIPAGGIVVEDRVRQKCMNGCYESGKYLTCPPHAPPVEAFRKSLGDYRYALLVKFSSGAVFAENIRSLFFRALIDPAVPETSKESAVAFLAEFIPETQKLHKVMLDLEQAAINAGYPFALTTICGPGCRLCETCNVQEGKCIRPTMKRFAPEALGINVVKTTADAGMPIHFPALCNPERIAILLID
jgi:predicted metal-binding protein